MRSIRRTFGHYRVLDRLGQGGMGEVYLVEDVRLQRRAALKLISPTLTRDEARRQRFVQEARLAASIDHPHIAAIYDVGEFEGRTFIVMEYVEGRSLREVLKAGPLRLRQALDYAIEAGDALAKVHERGVVHRDLKPENLLIASDGYLKVIDFGLAKLADPLARSGLSDATTMADEGVRTADGVVMGTVGYMSPEQVRGEAADSRSDVFSFGAVLYEMVAGTAPFRKKSAAETMSAILVETPASPDVDDGAGGELQRIIGKCLAKDPGARYQGMRDLVIDLRQLRERISGSASMARPVRAEAKPASRWTWSRITTAAALAGALVATVWGLAWQRPTGSPDPGAAQRPALAIVPFEILSGNQDAAWLGKGLPSMLITGLAQTPDIEVIGNERLSDAARQVGAAGLDAVERSQFAELARRAGARFVLSGSIITAGDQLRIDARVEDLETGAVRLAETVRGSDALALADDLAARVRAGLDVDLAPGAVRPVAAIATSSIEAYRAYVAGSEAELNLRLDDARRLFQEAVALDPGFGSAYLRLATVSDFQGRMTESHKWVQEATAHTDRMLERDAMLVRAELARTEGRIEESERLLDDLVRRYPETELAWVRLGFPAYAADPQRALDVFERAVAALPHSPGLLNLLGYAQIVSGRAEEGLRSFEGYAKLRPSEANALDSLAEGYLMTGRPDEAFATFEAALAGGYSGGHSGKALSRAAVGRYDEGLSEPSLSGTVRALLLSRVGRYREAEQLLANVRQQYAANGWIEGVASVDLVTATYALERGRCTEAVRDAAAARGGLATRPRAVATPWLVYADLVIGVCDAREGRLDDARRRIDHARQLHRSTSPLERWWLAALEGEVALSRNDHDAAARAWAAGMPAGRMLFARHLYFFVLSVLGNNLILRDGPARSAAVQGRTTEAIEIYRRLLSWGPDQPWTAALEPRYVLALAQLLERAGDREAARVQYRRFLDLWEAADSDLPELADARAALGR